MAVRNKNATGAWGVKCSRNDRWLGQDDAGRMRLYASWGHQGVWRYSGATQASAAAAQAMAMKPDGGFQLSALKFGAK